MTIRIWCAGAEHAMTDDLSHASNEFWYLHYHQRDEQGNAGPVVRQFRSLAAAQDVALVVAGPEGGGAIGDIWVADTDSALTGGGPLERD